MPPSTTRTTRPRNCGRARSDSLQRESTAWEIRTTSGRWPIPAPAVPAQSSTTTSVRILCRLAIPDAFVDLNEAGIIIELWNLVFMQFDKDKDGHLHPLPASCVDTGAGLERIAAVLQGADSNYHTDSFAPLLQRVAELVGRPYERDTPEGVSYRVLADHARAVAFLLADGVFPSSEGRGYVLRRILRRAVRHGWLMGRREPTLVGVVEAVIDSMGDVYPELEAQREHVLGATRSEEERFLATIEGGLERFGELASGEGGTIPGDEAFKLYDTFGFPLDLTQLMPRSAATWSMSSPSIVRSRRSGPARGPTGPLRGRAWTSKSSERLG